MDLDVGADDVAGEDVDHYVRLEIRALDWAQKLSDVARVHLPRCGRPQFRTGPGGWRACRRRSVTADDLPLEYATLGGVDTLIANFPHPYQRGRNAHPNWGTSASIECLSTVVAPTLRAARGVSPPRDHPQLTVPPRRLHE